MDDDAIKAQHGHGGLFLELDCGNLAFQRFKELCRAEAKLSEAEVARVCTIVIVDMGNKPPRKTRVRDIGLGVGCAVCLTLFLGVFGVGIRTIWQWLMAP